MKKNFFPTCTLCDTTFTDYDYSDYEEFCEMNDYEPHGKDSEDFYDWVNECREDEYSDLISNLKYSDVNDSPCLLIGSCGGWQGRREIMPYRFESIVEAIEKCANNTNDIKVTLKNGVIYISAYHHDGTNCFELYKLSKKGIKATEDCYNDVCSKEHKPYWLAKWHDYLF